MPPACNKLVANKTSNGGSAMRLIWPWQDRQRRFSWLKASAFMLVLLPGIRLTYQTATGEFGLLAMAYGGLTYWSGVWATVVLLMALAVTPIIVVFRWPALIDVRRMIGVMALIYTIAHIILFFGLRSWNFERIGIETVTRLTIFVATLSTIGLIILAATSLDAAIQRMGVKGWQRLHNTNYIISALALLHVVLARGTYAEQYLLCGLFVWLMLWRVLDRYRLGCDVKALIALAVFCCLFTAFLEAGFMWGRRGYDIMGTLHINFMFAPAEIGIQPPWQVLAFGLVFAFGAMARAALRVRTASIAARQTGSPA
jgi:methionine sulfoxide reductase heme-binding subunit